MRKHPAETLKVPVDYAARLGVGETIVSAAVSVVSPGTITVDPAGVVAGSIVTCTVSGGTDGKTDSFLVLATTSTGEVLSATVEVSVRSSDAVLELGRIHYATLEGLKNRLPAQALADLTTESGSEPDDEMLDSILSEVDGLIDTAANTGGYATPIVSESGATKTALESHTLSIAKFLILDRRGMTAYDPASETLYKAALAFLGGLQKGDIELAGAPLRVSPATSTGSVIAGSEARVFGRGFCTRDPRRGI